LLARGGKALDGQLLETFANPVKPRRGAQVLEGEDEIDAFLREGMRGMLRIGSDLLGANGTSPEKKKPGEKNPPRLAEPRLPPLFHLPSILADGQPKQSRNPSSTFADR